jgi:hypothetical protein
MTSFLAISTPVDDFNFYSKLEHVKDPDTGDPIFNVLKKTRICKDCLLLPTHEEQLACTHIEDTAHWKNPKKLKRLKVLYEGHEARGLRELTGMAASDFTPCFQKDDIQNLMDAPRYHCKHMPDVIYTAVDPSGGGPSHMGICSGFYDGNTFVVSLFFYLTFFFLHLFQSYLSMARSINCMVR